jgi:hypothetical protein
MRTRLALLAGAAAAAALLASAPAALGRAEANGGTFTGPTWISGLDGTRTTKWQVRTSGVACTFATTWAKKLLRRATRGEVTKLVGPAGWACRFGGGNSGGKGRAAWGPVIARA